MTRGRWPLRAAVVTVTAAALLVAGCTPIARTAGAPAGPAGAAVVGGASDPPPAAGTAGPGPDRGTTTGPTVAPAGAHRGRWSPRPGLTWQIQLAGDPVATGASVYDLDPYATAEQLVRDLHAAGALVICHLDVGVADATLPDAARLGGAALGPATTPPGAPGHWLDIRRWDLIAPVLADRLDLCRTKGFDAVDLDGADTYARRTGLPLTAADQVTYDQRLAGLARAAGLAVGERTGTALAARLLPALDFAVVDGCFAGGDCAAWLGYVDGGRAVFDVETRPPANLCARAAAYGFAATSARPGLGGPGTPCP